MQATRAGAHTTVVFVGAMRHHPLTDRLVVFISCCFKELLLSNAIPTPLSFCVPPSPTFSLYGPALVEFGSRTQKMSSHSSDVYVMEDSAASQTAGSAASQPEGLVRSSSFTSSKSSNGGRGGQPAAASARVMCTIGTNTEQQVEETVSSLLQSGIMGLMHTVAGDEFAYHMLQKSSQDVQRGCAERVIRVAQGAVDALRELTMRQTTPMRVKEPPSGVVVEDVGAEPDWLTELRLSMAKTDSLLEDITKQTEAVSTAVDAAKATGSIPMVPAAMPTVPPPSLQQAPSFSPPPQAETERIQELEHELRSMQEQLAEVRVVFAKEGVDSVMPLYSELLSLRGAKREAALRDVESTMAYLATQQCCFEQQLETIERRKRALDLESCRRFYQGGDAVVGLAADVEKLAQLGRQINLLRDEYRRRAAEVDPTVATTSTACRGEKRQRTSEDSFRVLLDRQSEKDEELMALREELNTQRRETEEWRRRYESAVQAMSPPQQSTFFTSLLRDVEGRVSQEAFDRCALLCRLFGWELLELKENTVSLARLGCAEEQLTLPMPEASGAERNAVARSIVLAKKVLEGSVVKRGERQESRHADEEQYKEPGGRASTLEAKENAEAAATDVAREATPLQGDEDREVDERGEGADEAGAEASSQENPLLEEEDTPDSPANLEPSFYNSGLWEE
ncbi:uncharacterized protein Tco025E_05341 [Trypanosoma conorhini]|uniref:Uncharacterized protein n=1 Tax=Trypanosoma conorhini TaxID=83891 RepID=A0A422PDW6_9TRYP|nr:uncharacterized protein Tco025E_05341 [Trypanosoma conorhini]RNF15906.1 hypothetical protein Tco025E_05341 [Trypanosoma conorhini]